ncbi:hypothetical protein Btru_039398 [Bulinus truncatus]|nr:hypothetical protein Btru_039398 [Bulinus truncatus]
MQQVKYNPDKSKLNFLNKHGNMIQDNCVTNTQQRERKFSVRLAKKKKDTSVLPATENCDEKNCSTEILIENDDVFDIEKLKNSKQFLECLELKPVKLEQNQDKGNSSGIVNLCAATQSKTKFKRNLSTINETKSKIKSSKARKAQRHCKKINKSKHLTNETKENETTAKQGYNNINASCDDKSEETNIIIDEKPLEHKKKENSSTKSKTLSDRFLGRETTWEGDNLDNQCEKKLKQIYIFRDLNRIAPIDDKTSFKDEAGTDLLSAVDLNRHGKKRRYDKLMKKLEDGERIIESNLKEVKLMEDDDGDKEDIDHCVEKLKEKLRVREKKKYEYLINYMRDQWKVDQQSFQDLLPQKVDQVKADVVKQLGAHTDKVVPEKRLRGRPRKINALTSEEKKETSAAKKPRINPTKKNGSSQRRINSASQRGFPIKFPKSLLPDANLAQNRHKFENFRLGIVDKDGGQKIIELNCDTLNQANHVDDSNSPNTSPFKEGNSNPLSLDSSKLFVSHAVTVKTPPTTITLPSISSLEKDYELVSLLPSCPPCIGNIKNDHFYIPQSTFDQDGKTSMIIVGPFCMVFEPKPRLVLVSPEQSKKGPAMILRRKIHSPSKTPPRDFRIRRDSSRTFRPSEHTLVEFKRGEQGDPATVAHDHDYMTPLELRDNVRRYCKAVAKHSANARFIDARVEDITKEEDNLVVTIKGDNLLRRVKNLSSLSQVPMQNNEDGMPIVYSLSQIMMSSLQKAQLMSKREEMVLESRQSGDYSQILFPLSSMGDVVMEVLIPPGGTEIEPKPKSKSSDNSNRIQDSVSNPEIMENFSDEVKFLNMGEVKFLNSNSCIDCESPDISHALSSKEFSKDNMVIKQLHRPEKIRSEFTFELVKELVRLDKDTAFPLFKDSRNKERVSRIDYRHASTPDPNEEDDIVPVENESAADGTVQHPSLRCCKVCLRLFPSDYVLFTHVRSHHATCESRDTVYLEELRARSHLACPACCEPPVYFATPSKLRRHLRQHHGIEHYVETCKFCRSEFLDKHELDLHMDLCHNAYPGRGLVSLLTPPPYQMVRSERSLLSCSRCNIVFSDRSSLLSHTLKVHPELNQFNICRLCDKVFDSCPALHKHLKKAHEQTHTGELKCPFCPAWLPDMDLASVHRLTLHSGAVPVHCPFCGYQSLHPMYNHVRIQHLQTEAHICPECQASFPSSRMLSEHARKVHLISPRIMKDTLLGANGTTYCCPFCTVSFMRTYDLAVHVINSHRDHLLPAQCHVCMQSFVNDIVMKMHMSGAHSLDVDGSDDSSFYDNGDPVVLDADPGLYGHSDGYVGRVPSRRLVPRHIIDHQDILETQGEMFGACSIIEDVQLLGETGEEFSLHGVDYLETLSNDSIAVGADVVADVDMEEMANGRGVMTRNHDLLGMARQFEMDGVLYELASSHEASNHHHLQGPNDMLGMDGGDRMTMDANDFAHLLRQQEFSVNVVM